MSKYDPNTLSILIELREKAGLSQDQAAAMVGLTGKRRRNSVSSWEVGDSRPSHKRRQPFMTYLLDGLRLRRDGLHPFEQLWQDVCVGEWGWKGLSEEELRYAFPSRHLQQPARPLARPPSVPPNSGREGKSPLTGAPFLAPSRPPYPLVGRKGLLSTLKEQLLSGDKVALCALNGLPGVGKTALATSLANDEAIRAHFCDGILWAGLGREPDVAALLGRWGTALSLSSSEMGQLPDLKSRMGAIHAAIGLRRMLLVVDDAWQVPDALAFKVGGPNCVHLLTTRLPKVAYTFASTNTFRVRELAEADGLALLKKLAPSVVAAEPEAARELVQAVGGLPLALILMGNYLQVRAYDGHPRRIREALEDLRDRTKRLPIPYPQPPLERPPSLPEGVPLSLLASIGISAQNLAPEARHALYALSVFPPKPNTFSEEAALCVCQTTPQTLDTLSDAGLLELNSSGRYTLHQTIADYAKLKLASTPPSNGGKGGEQAAYERMVAFYVEYVTLHQTDYASYPLLDLEMANVLAALQVAFERAMLQALVTGVNDFYHFMEIRGLYAQTIPLLERAKQAAERLGDAFALSRILHYQGESISRQGKYAEAEALFRESLVYARQVGHQHIISSLIAWLGVLAGDHGAYAQAQSYFEESLEIAFEIEDVVRIRTLYSNLGKNAHNRGDYAQSEEYLKQSLALARDPSDHERICIVVTNLGELASERGNYALALDYLRQGLAIARQIGHTERIGDILMNQGIVLYKRGQEQQAKECFEESLRHARRIRHPERLSAILQNIGAFNSYRGNYDVAEAQLEEGLSLARKIGHRKNITGLLLSLGYLFQLRDESLQAHAYVEEALALARQIKHPWLIAYALTRWGDFQLYQQEFRAAKEAFEEALERARALGAKELEAKALYGEARVAAKQDDLLVARQRFDSSLAIFEKIDHRKAAEVREWGIGEGIELNDLGPHP